VRGMIAYLEIVDVMRAIVTLYLLTAFNDVTMGDAFIISRGRKLFANAC